jgi:cellulose synthase/poly-beta-1,6-N-acetylglucosamine synthase-like glycosyltransferase
MFLLEEGVIDAADLIRVLALRSRDQGSVIELARANGLAREPALTRALARHHNLSCGDPLAVPPDPRLIDRLGPESCLQDAVLPWCRVGEITVILVPDPATFHRHRMRLIAVFGPVTPALAPRADIQTAISIARRAAFRARAQSRTALAESCRARAGKLPVVLLALAALIALSLILMPVLPLVVLATWGLVSLVMVTGLKFMALRAVLDAPPEADASPAADGPLPVVSVLVALYREADIAARLVQRLGRLDYPRDRLDLLLAVEETDAATRRALDRPDLPPWMRVIVVPDGVLRTKPRALNYALDFCRGSIVGVYDAEDAPEGDQIARVVARFANRDDRVACLQGVLDFYNPGTNWLSRCFTVEYASWFRVMLPGLQKLGLPLPLGGTTLFFRRAALERMGAWDAHNVTEDADLGMRLARHGYRTEMIGSVTGEEANCASLLSWVRQRSRWIKGYMMTWAVHMRDPVLLWRQLGPRGFLGFQILFLGSVSQALLAPLMLSFWAMTFRAAHPMTGMVRPELAFAMICLFVLAEGVTLATGLLGLRRARQPIHPLWVPALHFYHPFAALAAYKALWEMVRHPFFWDKTTHGRAGGLTAA